MTLSETKQFLYDGNLLTKKQAFTLLNNPTDLLCRAANEVREHFCGNAFDICTIVNGKCGKCSEDCKYCAQSVYYQTPVEEYPLLSAKPLLEQAKYNHQRGILRYSVVTSGKRLSEKELASLCESYRYIKEQCDISLCASHGLLSLSQFEQLKQSGITRYHNNLETSRRNFPNVCTTHTYEDKIEAIRSAKLAGLEVCSGGIIGMGETMEDRIDMILDIRELGVSSIPVNILNPIQGTPFETVSKLKEDEILKTIAIFRLLVPHGAIRLAGGRGLLADKGEQAFCSGANAAISGDMLTTNGISIQEDMQMLTQLGFCIKKI